MAPDAVGIEDGIDTHQIEVVNQAMRGEQPVKRVSMVQGHRLNCEHVPQLDRQQLNPVDAQLIRKQRRYRWARVNLPVVALIDSSQALAILRSSSDDVLRSRCRASAPRRASSRRYQSNAWVSISTRITCNRGSRREGRRSPQRCGGSTHFRAAVSVWPLVCPTQQRLA